MNLKEITVEVLKDYDMIIKTFTINSAWIDEATTCRGCEASSGLDFFVPDFAWQVKPLCGNRLLWKEAACEK
ncbi:hypothetical protein RvY_01812 [Ramazzottius varieornatus]|uniref:Uncharacterized protein n=1 Tax=Ramazzottius varieornatus TaxID=947166 RepID=A0A1D1UPP7_RAMVA|nr:hypothetical protein RvY_01812 [Ramazzottius varieornatus]